MKGIGIAVFSMLSGFTITAAPRIVSIENRQLDHSSQVEVAFTLGGEAVVAVDVKTNGCTIGWRNFRSALSGVALNRVNPAGSYMLTWDPSQSWKCPQSSFPAGTVTIEVTAWSPDDPPSFMDVDLTSTPSVVAYYSGEDELPWPVGDVTYKTTHLLMKRIPAANRTWMMGSPSSEESRSPKAAGSGFGENLHPVCLSHDFYMGVYELTQGQWKNCGLTVPSGQSVVGDAYPVANFNYETLRGFWNCWWPDQGHKADGALKALRDRTSVQFDLPTEAQWEFACRGGTISAFCDGTDSTDGLGAYAVYSENAPKDGQTGSRHAEVVGSKLPNGFGLYDMVGNVSEFCVEQRTGYGIDAVTDPKGVKVSQDANNCNMANRGSCYWNEKWAEWDNSYGASVNRHRSAYRGSDYWSAKWGMHSGCGARLVAPVSRAWPTVAIAEGTVAQDDSRRVAISYTLEEDAIVTLELYRNGIRISDESLRAVCGDVNRVVTTRSGNSKCIYWTPDASWPRQEIAAGELSFKIRKWRLDDPPAYMALDLTRTDVTNVAWYASAEAMPEPVTNDIWKTDYLVMRRIPAKDVSWWAGIATNETGASVEDVGYDPAYSVRHRVCLSQDFYMAIYELTRRQTRVFGLDVSTLANKEKWTRPYGDKYTAMRWDGGGCAWPENGHGVHKDSLLGVLRRLYGIQFDLPTEAQWEYACRAGSDERFYGYASSLDCQWNKSNSGGDSHPVGLKKPNAWGLYDMLGNLCEWCLDRYDEKYGLTPDQLASETPTLDPCGPFSSSANHALRGGWYDFWDYQCRTGDRSQNSHCDSNWMTPAFRLVCPLPGETFVEPVRPDSN